MSHINFTGACFAVNNTTNFVDKVDTGFFSVIHFNGSSNNIQPMTKNFSDLEQALAYSKRWISDTYIQSELNKTIEFNEGVLTYAKNKLEFMFGIKIPNIEPEEKITNIHEAFSFLIDTYTDTLPTKEAFNFLDFVLTSLLDDENSVFIVIEPILLENTKY
jgi:hypothetical protein